MCVHDGDIQLFSQLRDQNPEIILTQKKKKARDVLVALYFTVHVFPWYIHGKYLVPTGK